MPRTSSLERAGNFTRISTENIIQADVPVRLTRRGSREMTTSMETTLARRNSGERVQRSTGRASSCRSSQNTTKTAPPSSQDQLPRPAAQISAQLPGRRGSADITADNILDSPSAPRQTRRGSAGYHSAVRTRSRRQEVRHDPMTQKGRNGPKQSGSTKRPKRVRFAIPLLPYEARELLAEARRMTETVASSNAAEAEEAVDDAASETDEDAPTAQHDSVHPEADGTDEYALYEEAAAAVEESVDPKVNVIQRLALRAASDPGLRALMRLVASRRASRHQLSELQQHINEIDETDNDAADSEHSDVEIAATGMEEDSSHEPEMDDKENVGPTSSQGFGAHRPSGPSTNTDYSIDRGGPQPRSALRLLPVVAPTNRPSNPPTAAAATPGARAPSGPRRESEASLNNRVRNSVHLQNAQRLRGEADAMAERARQHPADGTPERRPSQNRR